MLGPLRHTIIKEFITLIRDPAALQILIRAPLAQLLVFSFAASMEVRNIDIAVINDDSGRWSQELVMRIQAASFVDSIIVLPNATGLDALIDRRKVLLAVHLPSDFSRRIDRGELGKVQLTFDGRRANTGQITFSYIQGIVNELNVELANDAAPIPVATVRHWFNPNLIFLWFMVPALVATLALIPTFSMSTLSVAREREMGTFDQLVVSPVSTLEIILGKLLPAVFAGMSSGTLITILAIFAYGIAFNGSMALMFLSMLVFVFAIAGIGLMISASCNTQQQAFLGMFGCMIVIMVTSGFLTPVDNMPDYLQVVAQLNPLRHFLEIVLGSFLKSMTTSEILDSLWPLVIIGMVTVSGASIILRRSLH
ncbi:MAG: ABC transporter permease [Halioglobus sp.]